MYNLLIINEKPIAALLCSGFIPAFDLGMDVGDYARHVLVVAASKQQESTKVTAEWKHEVFLAQKLGIIPFDENLPHEKVVGVIEVKRAPEKTGTFWTYNSKSPFTVYRILNAYLLDRPIGFERYPFHPKRLMSSAYQPLSIAIEGLTTLRIPLDHLYLENCCEDSSLTLPLTPTLERFLFHNGKPIHYKYVKFISNNQVKLFKFSLENEVFYPHNGNGDKMRVYSIMKRRHIALPYFIFKFGEQI